MLDLFDAGFVTKVEFLINRGRLSDIFAVALLEIALSNLRLQKYC